jgi:hypothetical protein
MDNDIDLDSENIELCWTLDLLQEDDSTKERVYLITALSLYDDDMN